LWFALQLFYSLVLLDPNQVQTGGVAYMAHVGGFVAGLVIALLARPFIQRNMRHDTYYPYWPEHPNLPASGSWVQPVLSNHLLAHGVEAMTPARQCAAVAVWSVPPLPPQVAAARRPPGTGGSSQTAWHRGQLADRLAPGAARSRTGSGTEGV